MIRTPVPFGWLGDVATSESAGLSQVLARHGAPSANGGRADMYVALVARVNA